MPRGTVNVGDLSRAEWIAFHSFCNYRTVIAIGGEYIWSHNAEKADGVIIQSLIDKGLVEIMSPAKYATQNAIYGLASGLRPRKRP